MPLIAVIDESGQRARTARSSDHFTLSAVIYRDTRQPYVTELLETIRADLGRQPGQRLHWEAIKTHGQRLQATDRIGGATYLKVISVVVSKRLLPPVMPHEHRSYMFTFRLLLERLSWLAEDHRTTLGYTLSHVRRFPMAKLREYEHKLRDLGNQTTIKWDYLDPHGGRLENDKKVEELQLADIVASSTQNAFEPDAFGHTENHYLLQLAPRLYRHPDPRRSITSYGLKMHPWNDAVRAAHPWIANL